MKSIGFSLSPSIRWEERLLHEMQFGARMQEDAKPRILSHTRVILLKEVNASLVEVKLGLVHAQAGVSELAAISGTLSRGLRRYLTPEVFEELPRLIVQDGERVAPRAWSDSVLSHSKSCTVTLAEKGVRPLFRVQMLGLTLEIRLAELGALAGSFRHAIRRIFSSPSYCPLPPIRATPALPRQGLTLVKESASLLF